VTLCGDNDGNKVLSARTKSEVMCDEKPEKKKLMPPRRRMTCSPGLSFGKSSFGDQDAGRREPMTTFT